MRDFAAEWEAALESRVDALLAEMTVADRVGQLFLVAFSGNDTGFESDIAELIHGYRIGGVLLTPRTGNFTNQSGADTPRTVTSLANRLQALAYGHLLSTEAAIPDSPPEPPSVSARAALTEPILPDLEQLTGVPPVNLPLFITVNQTGDHLPNTALRRGFTPLPSQMALGAAWNPELTRRVGAVAGHELSTVGVNMLLGPNLDVIDPPRLNEVGSLGLHSFGGNPYWVAQQARAYITGIHEGSGGRVATIAGNFPGAGDIDRLPDREVATVQRSLHQLRRYALPPFWSVTRYPSSILTPIGDIAATDGIMSSHTRYSAFQGSSSGRATPLSLTPELSMVMEQEGISSWRTRGGIMVSNSLGAPSIRRYYSPTQEEFPYRRVALDAFAAGHDILLLDQFSLDNDWETQKRNIKATVGFFQERYVNDSAFAQQVDESVRRVLRLKLRLYDFDPIEYGRTAMLNLPPVQFHEVLISAEMVARLDGEHRATAQAVMSQVARESFTTLYPDTVSASELLSAVPQADENIVIFTESRLLRECSTCLAEPAVGPDEVADIMERLYGPGATGQLDPNQIVSLTFAELVEVLAQSDEEDSRVEPVESPLSDSLETETNDPEIPPDKIAKINMQLAEAEWIIFVMLDVNEEMYPHSGVVKQFLRERGDAMSNKQLVVFALHAPYFLDATEISKLHAYYGVYGKTQPFIENAIRGFFRSYTPNGAPPVSVAGTRFANLLERTLPDPTRPIELRMLDENDTVLASLGQEEGTPLPVLDAPDTVRIQAGPVYDANGKIVHDGLPVEFTIIYEDEEGLTRQETAMTRNGLATREISFTEGGTIRIQASTGEASSVPPLFITIRNDVVESESAEGLSGTGAQTETTTPTLALTGLITGPVETIQPGNFELNSLDIAARRLSMASFVAALLTMATALGMLLILQIRSMPRRVIVQSTLLAFNCGLAAYVLYGLGWTPYGEWLEASLRTWGAAPVVLVAMIPALFWVGIRAE